MCPCRGLACKAACAVVDLDRDAGATMPLAKTPHPVSPGACRKCGPCRWRYPWAVPRERWTRWGSAAMAARVGRANKQGQKANGRRRHRCGGKQGTCIAEATMHAGAIKHEKQSDPTCSCAVTADHRCSRGATRKNIMLISGALVGGAGELVWQCRASRRQKSPRALVGSVLLTSPQEHSLERSTRRCIAVCQTGEKQTTEKRKSNVRE